MNINDKNSIINKLNKLDINYITDFNIKKINDDAFLGKGSSGSIFKSQYNTHDVAVKFMEIFTDTPLIKTFTDNEIIGQTSVIDIIISSILSNYKHPTVQKFYGYLLTDKYIIMLKEWCEYDFLTFIKNKDKSLISNLLLHVVLSIKQHFQTYLNGYYFDTKLENILIKSYDQEYVSYFFNGQEHKIKAFGFIPVITDFGVSIILKKDNNKMLIKRHIDWKKPHKHQITTGFYGVHKRIINNNIFFDEGFDLFHLLFVKIKMKCNIEILIDTYIVKKYIEALHQRNIYRLDDYKINILSITDFLKYIM